MGQLGLSPRSENYVKRVMKVWGKYMPYVSPFRDSKHAHMMNLVTSDAGHKVQNKNNTPGLIVTTLKLVGARILNRLSGDKAKYRKQFVALASSYGKADRDWIETRANELFTEMLNERIDSEKAKAVRSRSRAARMIADTEAA